MKNWKRTLLIGFIWGTIFFGWFLNNFLTKNWDFHLFNYKHWLFLIDEFRKGWTISAKSDWIFLVVILTMFPIFFGFWAYAVRVKWLDLLHLIMGKVFFFLTGTHANVRPLKKLKLEKKSSKTTRPRAMDGSIIRPASKESSEMKASVASTPSNGFSAPQQSMGSSSFSSPMAFGTNPSAPYNPAPSYNMPPRQNEMDMLSGRTSDFSIPAGSPFGKEFSMPSMQQSFSVAPSPLDKSKNFDDILLEDIKLPERDKVEENLEDIFEKAGYTLIRDVQIGKMPIHYVAVGQKRVILCYVDSEKGDWLADEERFNGEDPLWFSESSHRVSPVFRLVNETKSFMDRLSQKGFSGSVMPVFVEKLGTIINAEDMLTTWRDMSVVVCRTDVGGPDELPIFGESIPQDDKTDSETIALVQSAL